MMSSIVALTVTQRRGQRHSRHFGQKVRAVAIHLEPLQNQARNAAHAAIVIAQLAGHRSPLGLPATDQSPDRKHRAVPAKGLLILHQSKQASGGQFTGLFALLGVQKVSRSSVPAHELH